MMMTSGHAVKYRDSFHCFAEIIRLEGVGSLFKGAAANIVRVSGGEGLFARFVRRALVGATTPACSINCSQR